MLYPPTGNVRNVTTFNCSVIVWDAPEDEHCCDHELTYKVRMYSGITFENSSASQKKVFWTPNKWVTFSAADIPTGRPLVAIVSVCTHLSSSLHAQHSRLLLKLLCGWNRVHFYIKNVVFVSLLQVKARNSEGRHSSEWTDPITVTGIYFLCIKLCGMPDKSHTITDDEKEEAQNM